MTTQRSPADTVIALASGSGRAGVAVVRVSGPQASAVLRHLAGSPVPARRAVMRTLREAGDYLDQALVLFMPGPHSFTGEDVVEFHIHGGRAVIEAVVSAALRSKLCRPAEPGEFTRRAVEHGRLDLTQAEAIADLIDAETDGQRRQAARVYQGEAARIFEGWRAQLIAAMAALEAAIDFADEADVPDAVAGTAREPMEDLAAELERALGESHRLRAVREGFRIAILGPPNAGKSSLMNRLAREEAAIVSALPGTTRDVVEVRIILAGFPVWIADTAGLRATADAIEAEGVRRALARAEAADLRLWVLDASLAAGADVSRETLFRDGDLLIRNKADLLSNLAAADGRTFAVSALTGAGMEALESALTERVRDALGGDEAPVITRARHRHLVEEALSFVRRAIVGAKDRVGAELVAEDLRLASRALGRVTGAVDADDLLDSIFSSFCIGK